MATKTTTNPATTPIPREARTHWAAKWHQERDVWVGATIAELHQRVTHQETPNNHERRWRIVSTKRQGQSVVAEVRRLVYCDPPDLDPMVVRLCERYSRIARERWEAERRQGGGSTPRPIPQRASRR